MQLKQNYKAKSQRPVKMEQNKTGMRLRTGVKAGAGTMVYDDDVLWNRPPENERPLP